LSDYSTTLIMNAYTFIDDISPNKQCPNMQSGSNIYSSNIQASAIETMILNIAMILFILKWYEDCVD
jgi:hypothetical protein